MYLFMKKKSVFLGLLVVFLIALFAGMVLAQTNGEDLIKDLRWRNIGPANMSGRVSDIEALDNDFTKVFVAAASGGVWKSVNAGSSFEPIFDKYGAASIGDIAIFQKNPEIIWVGTGEECGRNSIAWGDGIYKSTDGGKTWQRFPGQGIHSDYHALWLDPHNKDRFYVGNDGGSYLTHDHGRNFIKFDNFVISQFYMIGVDMRDPFYVYGGLQDNGTWGGPTATRDRAIYTDLWYTISGGDGYHIQVDPTDWRIVYSEPHPGNTGGRIQRENVETRVAAQIRPQKGENIVNYDEYITPEMEQLQLEKGWGPSPGNGSGAFRWNWSSPIVMSPHNPDTIFFGANHLFKTVDQGETWYLISPDLSKNDPYKTIKESGGLTPDHDPGGGAEFHGTIITISESPVKAGVIWVGTDDGNVQVTQNDGEAWMNVRANVPGVPDDLWVSRVEASHFSEGTLISHLTVTAAPT